MRARYPDTEGFIERAGVKVGYQVFGAGEPAVVFPPIDGIVHSRCWKAQVPYLARFFKVVTIDPRGNGRSDRPQSAEAYADTEWVADTIAAGPRGPLAGPAPGHRTAEAARRAYLPRLGRPGQ